MTKHQLLTIKEVCTIMRYEQRKVYELIKDGKLRTFGEGRGLRVVAASVDALIEQEADLCPANASPKPGAKKAKARTAGTLPTNATSGASLETDDATKSRIVKLTGPKLDLKL